MRIGVPKEIKTHEYRVGLTPASVRELCEHGHDVLVETKAGEAIGMVDAVYEKAGARIGSGLAQAGAAALVLLIVIANMPGLGDGIEPESWPLAILIDLCGLYAVGAVVIGAWSRARG